MNQTFTEVPRPAPQTSPLNILVTGAARGIGFQLVKQYAEAEPRNIIVAAVRDVEAAGPLATFASSHPNVFIIPLDAGDEGSINASLSALPPAFTHLDLLYNNAGVFGGGAVGQMTADTVNTILRVNVTGPLLIIQAYRALLLKAKAPKVINVSSEFGATHMAEFIAGLGVVPYGASKGGVEFCEFGAADGGAGGGVSGDIARVGGDGYGGVVGREGAGDDGGQCVGAEDHGTAEGEGGWRWILRRYYGQKARALRR